VTDSLERTAKPSMRPSRWAAMGSEAGNGPSGASAVVDNAVEETAS